MHQRARSRFARCPAWAALIALATLVGCDDDESGSLPGELGDNHFFYGCSTIDDAHCREGLTSFPDKVAVGARFEINAKAGNGTTLTARPASPVMIASASGEFEFRRAGFGAFVALDFDEFVDFAHLQAVEVDGIDVLDAFGSAKTEMVLRRNQRTTITAVPLDADGDTLAGSLVYRWATDNDAVLAVKAVGTSVELRALDVGVAQLRVSLGDDVSRVLQVSVHEVPTPPTDAGGGGDAGPFDGSVPDAAAPDGGAPDTEVPDGGGLEETDGGDVSDASGGSGSDVSVDGGSGSNDTSALGGDAALDGGGQ